MKLSRRIAVLAILGAVAITTTAYASISGSKDWCYLQAGSSHYACDYDSYEACKKILPSTSKGSCHHRSESK